MLPWEAHVRLFVVILGLVLRVPIYIFLPRSAVGSPRVRLSFHSGCPVFIVGFFSQVHVYGKRPTRVYVPHSARVGTPVGTSCRNPGGNPGTHLF